MTTKVMKKLAAVLLSLLLSLFTASTNAGAVDMCSMKLPGMGCNNQSGNSMVDSTKMGLVVGAQPALPQASWSSSSDSFMDLLTDFYKGKIPQLTLSCGVFQYPYRGAIACNWSLYSMNSRRPRRCVYPVESEFEYKFSIFTGIEQTVSVGVGNGITEYKTDYNSASAKFYFNPRTKEWRYLKYPLSYRCN